MLHHSWLALGKGAAVCRLRPSVELQAASGSPAPVYAPVKQADRAGGESQILVMHGCAAVQDASPRMACPTAEDPAVPRQITSYMASLQLCKVIFKLQGFKSEAHYLGVKSWSHAEGRAAAALLHEAGGVQLQTVLPFSKQPCSLAAFAPCFGTPIKPQCKQC